MTLMPVRGVRGSCEDCPGLKGEFRSNWSEYPARLSDLQWLGALFDWIAGHSFRGLRNSPYGLGQSSPTAGVPRTQVSLGAGWLV